MSDLDQLTNIIITILGKDNDARQHNEELLNELQSKDIDQYVAVFVNLLNGIIFNSFLSKTSLTSLVTIYLD